ncbi:hypothetical protein [Choristoneura rosaceana nucleopolyhedrovirus]|uniref:Uncharacterized protein n=1 Tax=Choristoneura rosaceana nucleopolyhedrovirus TaxID=58094 RepID=S5MR81_9ABAC|nr:hypothetical protein [Choristoneura rosaceana nucleopolyhedrovirus]AGR57069.1 hypothetical protein [Choristoneura rosaceana nucleopolyhedrovirus]
MFLCINVILAVATTPLFDYGCSRKTSANFGHASAPTPFFDYGRSRKASGNLGHASAPTPFFVRAFSKSEC